MPSDIRNRLAVPTERLRRACDPATVDASPDPAPHRGQTTALAAVDLGLNMSAGGYEKSHYNIVVVGSPNTGRTAKTLEHVRERAEAVESAPPDAVCIPNFDEPRRPSIVFVPNGKGHEITKRLEIFGLQCMGLIPLELADFRKEHVKKYNEAIGKLWTEAAEKVQAFGYVILDDDEGGSALVSMSIANPGEPMTRDEYESLDDAGKEAIDSEEMRAKAHEIIEETQKRVRYLVAKGTYEGRKGEKEMVEQKVAEQAKEVREAAGESHVFSSYIEKLSEAAVKRCLKVEKEEPQNAIVIRQGDDEDEDAAFSRMFRANLLVDNRDVTHPPVIHVTVPQYSELFGQINAQFSPGRGTIKADHTLVEGGAFLKANGGYLILDLNDLLRWGGYIAYLKLLKTVRTRQAVIEGKSKFVDAEALVDFRTNEVPIDVRVIAVCDRELDYLLRLYEPEFGNLFRVVAEFDDRMPADDAPAAYAAFVELCRADGNLPPFSPEAVAKLVEFGVRRIGKQDRASTEFGIVKDIITEAAHWAKSGGAEVVGAEHVERAVEERFNRQALAIRRYQEFLDSGQELIDHEGSKVGQVNGLAVLAWSDEIRFGTPTRITARAFRGSDKVELVQRNVDTSGPSSNTAVEVIGGWLAGEFGREETLNLSVKLCFEQCYNGVDGDSASLAEVIAAISAITELPVDQRLAVTGSMNQWGEAQPIGGVNEKIEGHFGAIRRRGLLKGGHGVVIPKLNLENLMLKTEVIEAQKSGLYQVYAVSSIDEALEMFLGQPMEDIRKLAKKKLIKMGGDKGVKSFLRRLFRLKKKET
jgi:lon-related putative ATP-dependent protease